VGLGIVVRTTSMFDRGEAAAAVRLHRLVLSVLVVAYAIALGAMVAWAVHAG
jgi:hypothetical protein